MPTLTLLLLTLSPALCSGSRSSPAAAIAEKAHQKVQQRNMCPSNTFFNSVPVPGDAAESACGEAVWGKLMIGVHKAVELEDADTMWGGGHSDPFTRLRFLSGKQEVFKEMMTSVKTDDENPIWREKFAIDFMCPQMPTQDDFVLEVAVRDDDSLRGDNMLGVTTLPLSEVLAIRGKKVIDLSVSKKDYKYSKGYLHLFLWFCEEGDAACKSERDAADENFPSAIKDSRSTNCYMGCDRVLLSGLEDAINEAAKDVKESFDLDDRANAQAQQQKRLQYELKETTSHALAFSYNQSLVDSKLEKILTINYGLSNAVQEYVASLEKREQIWAKVGLAAQEFANSFRTIAARENVCSSGSKVEDLMERVSEPLRDHVNKPSTSGFGASFKRGKAQELINLFNGLKSSLSSIQTCLKNQWKSKRMILNSAKTSPKCAKLFND